jgi:NAD(P)-dependent dehydrogenase (short-subunit alcohol dehydrogenase family)
MRLANKVAVVTGGSRGIGRGIALKLASEGARVVVNYRTNSAAAEEVVGFIEKQGGEAIAVQADVSLMTEAKRLIKTTISTYGRLDILFNNA